MENFKEAVGVGADPIPAVRTATWPSMAVAIVNYNTRDHLRACLSTVSSESPGQVVVVDNASQDGSAAMVRSEYPRVELYANTTNPGFGAAANEAVSRCQSTYVLLLNSDTRVEPGALESLRRYLDVHPDVAIVGPRLANVDGSLQISCYPLPTPFNELLRWTTLGVLAGRIPFLRERYLPTSAHDRPRAVGWVVGAALAIRREAFQSVGGFDESFFMYSEEVDLCYRLQRAGWQVHFFPGATVRHVGGASTSQNRAQMAAQLYASLRQFYRRHYSRSRLTRLQIIVSYFMLRNLLRDRVRLRLARSSAGRDRLSEDVRVWEQVLAMMWRAR